MASWNGRSFSVLADAADPVIPWPSGDVLVAGAFHPPGSNYDVILTAGRSHRVLKATLWLDALVFDTLLGDLGVTATLSGWPVQGGGTTSFSGMMLRALSDRPIRRLTTSGEVYETQAEWWTTA